MADFEISGNATGTKKSISQSNRERCIYLWLEIRRLRASVHRLRGEINLQRRGGGNVTPAPAA